MSTYHRQCMLDVMISSYRVPYRDYIRVSLFHRDLIEQAKTYNHRRTGKDLERMILK